MFNKNTYMFTQGSTSPHTRISNTSHVLGLNGTEISFLHHDPDVFSGHYLTSNNAPDYEASNSFNQGFSDLIGYSSNIILESKQTVKKDRHSKIYTSQGPRDRRVRLSIAIARKFFDLQELLGFDKPSKTLDWLLTKSKSAIKDLDQKNQAEGSITSNGKNIISSSSECEVGVCAGTLEYALADSTKKCENKSKGVVIKDPQQVAAANLVKKTRAKARARARERTREKMSIKQLHGVKNTTDNSDLNYVHPSIPNQCRVFDPRVCEQTVYCPLTNELATEDFVQESVVIQRKVKQYPASILGFHQQNHVVSRDISVNYDMQSSNITAENWDFCGFTSHI